MSLVLGIDSFQKFAAGRWWVGGGGDGQKAFFLRLEAGTKLNNTIKMVFSNLVYILTFKTAKF